MRKHILIEGTLVMLLAVLATGLYQLVYGIELSYDNYFDMLLFETRRTVIICQIMGYFFLPIYIGVNILRQIYFKFLKLFITVEILISSIMLVSLLVFNYLFLESKQFEPASSGWTIHPPLSELAILNEQDALTVSKAQNVQLLLMAVVAIIATTIVLLTIRQRRKGIRV